MATILFGGSFDPIHNGHLAMIQTALAHLPHAKLLLVPAACSPFKTNRTMADEPHRFAMCNLVAEGHSRVTVSDIEFSMPKPSYTVHTLKALMEQNPDDYHFLCGADAFLSLQQWKDYKTLLSLTAILAVDRQGASHPALLRQKELLESEGGNITLLNMETVDVSSTKIRQTILLNQSLNGLVPEKVENYIANHGLYKE